MTQKFDDILLRERLIVLAFGKGLKMPRPATVRFQGFRRIMADFNFAVQGIVDKNPTAAGPDASAVGLFGTATRIRTTPIFLYQRLGCVASTGFHRLDRRNSQASRLIPVIGR